MNELSRPIPSFGGTRRGVTLLDVEQAADALMRMGERPTARAVRERLGTGSMTTINPFLDTWWKRLSSRLDSGPAAVQRLPENVAHVAEALWLQALGEGRRRATLELGGKDRTAQEREHALELRGHHLSLREGELEGRLQERDRRIDDLELRLRETTFRYQKAEASIESLTRQLGTMTADLARRRPLPRLKRTTKASPPKPRPRKSARRTAKAKKGKRRR